jgi:hypothetical protein
MKFKYSHEWFWFLLGGVVVIFAATFGHCAIISTYAKHYSDSARVHHNARYSPDSFNVATGWRELYGAVLWIEADNGRRVKVTARDVMNLRYDDCEVLHVDASPAVMTALGLKHRANVIVTVDIESLLKKQ